MIIYNGFVTGLIVGVLLGISIICIYALSQSDKRKGDE